MRLALIGWPVKHSLSPKLYTEILGDRLTSYDLLGCPTPADVPSLEVLSQKYDGINITSPYKRHFIGAVRIDSPIVRTINAVNTLAFSPEGVLATNTDVIAVEELLTRYLAQFGNIHLLLLGSGVMARVTVLVAEKLSIPVTQLSRRTHGEISRIDLLGFRKVGYQNVIVNSCSRDFVFEGTLSSEDVFWDYNYNFSPHAQTLPSLVKTYVDGQEMLRLQALAAVRFWSETKL